MRGVRLSNVVLERLDDLADYMTDELKVSEEATMRRIGRLSGFLTSLVAEVDYPLCRFKRWRDLRYRCAAFEGWVFAYEIFPDGVIVRDMSHGKMLAD